MNPPAQIRFSAIGLNHNHIYGQVNLLLRAGAQLASYFAAEEDLAQAFGKQYPQTDRADSVEAILEDPSIQLVVSAGIPCDRAPLGMRVMEHGKDYMSDKPGFTTLDQLAAARKVQAETGRIYSICFSERLEVRSAVKAGELIQSGAIGKVVQTIGLGPHRLNPPERPAWFFQKEKYGGILTDIASHQFDQFLYFTGSTQAEVVAAQVSNTGHPETPELEDFGEVMLRGSRNDGSGCSGYIRVDWLTPAGLPVWGDGRLTILGTDGYLELRKYIDIAGQPGGDHLFLVNQRGIERISCDAVDLPYGRQLMEDIRNRTQTAMLQEHVFLASQLALEAEQKAQRIA
jgi:predicted dehydrogenase